MESVPLVGLDVEHRIHLKQILRLTVPFNLEKRTSDVERLVGLLSQKNCSSPVTEDVPPRRDRSIHGVTPPVSGLVHSWSVHLCSTCVTGLVHLRSIHTMC